MHGAIDRLWRTAVGRTPIAFVWTVIGLGACVQIGGMDDPHPKPVTEAPLVPLPPCLDDIDCDDANPCSGSIPMPKPAPVGTACSGHLLCNGAGSCGSELGNSCIADAGCSSGFCVDGVCCNTACTENCKSCNVQGSVGTCTNTPFYASDGACGGPKVCDGQGACKFANGERCVGGADQCASGICRATRCKALEGQACTSNQDCAVGVCTNGVCS